MRLIELRLKNINSLKGEWHIDFADPAFINEGIFAITGQTGAGKTSILDALCLALYGETPRINSISKSSNEVMTRQTAECFAEVVIDLNGVQYRCRWGQRRAYGKPDGNLQDATHEIALVKTHTDTEDDSVGDEILESKLTRTKEKIIELTRMDFQQFTRSILLAQGSFSAFLKAKADERADILEKITGTDIYATISTHVYEKKRAEEEILSKLQYGLEGLSLLAADEEAAMREALLLHQSAQTEQQQTYQQLIEQLTWLDSVTALETQVATYQNDAAAAERAKADFVPHATRLIAANKALEMESQYSQLIHHRGALKQLQDELQTLHHQLPQQNKHLEEAKRTSQDAHARRHSASEALQTALPKIAQARRLDATIAQQTHSLADHSQREQTRAANIQRLRQEMTEHKVRLTQTKTQLDDVEGHLSAAAALHDIDTDAANFDSHCSRLKALLQDNAILASERDTHQHHIREYHACLDTYQEQHATNQAMITKTRETIAALQKKQAALTQDQSLADMRGEQEQIDAVSSQIEQIGLKGQRLRELSEQRGQISTTLPTLTNELAQMAAAIADNEAVIAEAKDRRQDKQKLLGSLQQVASLERYITQLKAGNPCPLCGALEHPYSEHHPLLDQESSEASLVQQQITDLEAAISDKEQALSQQRIDYATSSSQYQQLQAQKEALHHQIKTLGADISHLIKLLLAQSYSQAVTAMMDPLGQSDADMAVLSQQAATHSAEATLIKAALLRLDTSKHQLAQRKSYLKDTLTQYDALNDEQTQIRHTSESYEQQQYQLAGAIHEIETHIKVDSLALENNDKKTGANFTELRTLKSAILAIVNKYVAGTSASDLLVELDALQPLIVSIEQQRVLNAADYEAHLHTLRKQRGHLLQLKKQFDADQQTKHTLITALGGLKAQIDTKQAQLDTDEVELHELTQAIAEKRAELAQSTTERQAIFADRADISPDDEERRLRAVLEQESTALASAQRQLDNAEHTLKQLQEKQQQLAAQLQTATTTLSQQADVFQAALASSDFADETAFMSARLPVTERHALSEQQQELDNTLKQAQSLLAQTQQALRAKQAEALTTEDRDTLAARQQHVQNEIRGLTEAIGAMSQQLKDNEEKKASQQAKRQAIAEQQQTLQVWRQLNELIGSSSGKKYRTFAQGLTFDIMVNHANTQLHKMSDRYLLTRDDNSPLELNVIDNYQGGEIRSTKNLSGGEGFIISLALALGLSQMASHNIRVDSLFLDEGFGTLDEDSLDIALDTLTSLHQEGKLIGVISHVQALKDRILSQIKVEKRSGGFSQITGQGCRQVHS